MTTEEKYRALKEQIAGMESVAVAFSGGVDSSFLSKVCFDVLGHRAMAVTIVSPMMSQHELADARSVASLIGINHVLLQEYSIEDDVRKNPVNRCYFCKKIEFTSIIAEAVKNNMRVVIDGANADDCSDYRPGTDAARELNVQSPLQTAGFTKQEIRLLSQTLHLPTWNKPAYACLASRVPYGEEITHEKLRRIEQAEAFLQSLGFREVRVRSHNGLARIEVAPEERNKLFHEETMDTVARQFKAYGFFYVCMELEGYERGSMNRKVLFNEKENC